MATASLSANTRKETGKGAARKLRASKNVPGVIYGHHREPLALAVDARELGRLLDKYSPDTTVVELTVGGKVARTLIREIQRHPIKPEIIHIDFQELVAGEKVTVDIPILLTGIADGVRLDSGTLDQVMREIRVEVDPASIPNHFELDVTKLGLNDSLHVSDLQIPEGVKIFDEPEMTVCVVAPPRVEEAPAAPVEGVEPATEPELIRKPREGEEEEGATEE
ncbi:MAG: 50S ribosomal protein L25 [Gemmatimonadaceae bacterium]